MTTVLVTGATGTLGGYAADAFPDSTLVLTDPKGVLEPLDVTDAEAVQTLFARVRPDVVLHLAAVTNVDLCELDPDLAFRTNAVGTEHVARAAAGVDSKLVYVSTAAVFDGSKDEPYAENDATGPANVYGRSKLAGEEAVARLAPRNLIVRASWLVGGGELDKKFVGKLTAQMEQGQTHLRAVNDKVGSPTVAREFLQGIRNLLDDDREGLYHLVNGGGACSRYDIAIAVREALGRNDVVIEAVSSDEFPLPAPRGRSEALENDKLRRLGSDPMRHWRDALGEYIAHELLPAFRKP